MKNINLQVNIKIPKTPKVFFCKDSNLLLTIENIKKVAEDFNCSYTLDYLNARVFFIDKNHT